MLSAFKSFFSRAANEESKGADGGQPEFNTYEQVQAAKFDSRAQIFYLSKRLKQDSQFKLEHPNYLTDRLKTSIFKSIMRHRTATMQFVEQHDWSAKAMRPPSQS